MTNKVVFCKVDSSIKWNFYKDDKRQAAVAAELQIKGTQLFPTAAPARRRQQWLGKMN